MIGEAVGCGEEKVGRESGYRISFLFLSSIKIY